MTFTSVGKRNSEAILDMGIKRATFIRVKERTDAETIWFLFSNNTWRVNDKKI
jgi:hypothetical protein